MQKIDKYYYWDKITEYFEAKRAFIYAVVFVGASIFWGYMFYLLHPHL